MLEIMGNDNSLSFGMEENGALVAIALGRVKHWHAGTEYLVEELGVLPAWQGRGVGSALLAGMRRVLKTKGVGTVVLLTDRTLPAYKFYIGKGFFRAEGTGVPGERALNNAARLHYGRAACYNGENAEKEQL